MTFPTVKVGDLVNRGLADIQTGPFGTQLKASDYVAEGVPVINVRNIGYGNLRPEKLEHVSEGTSERLGVHVLAEQDIVFGRKGAVDRHLLVTTNEAGWVQGSDCIRIRFRAAEISPRFVSYAFLRNYHKEWMLVQCGNKATMASLNQDVIRRIDLPLPRRDQQDAVASILSAYDDLIENNRRRIALLEESARLLYREWFVHLRFPGHEHVKVIEGVPDGWRRQPLGQIAIIKKGRNITKEAAVPGGVPVVAGGLKPAYFHNIANVIGPVITVSASGANAGYVGLYHTDIWASDCSFLSASDNEVLWFLYLSMKARQADITAMQQGAAQPHVYPKDLERLSITVPPTTLRGQFEESVASSFRLVANLEKQCEALAQARDLLLPRLMSGEVVV